MNALDELIEEFDVFEYSEGGKVKADIAKRAAAELAKLYTALDEARRVIEKLALLNWGFPIERDACAWLEEFKETP